MTSKKDWEERMLTIINDAQYSHELHERQLAALMEIYNSENFGEFAKLFLHRLLYPMSLDEKNEYADTLLRFDARFVVMTAPMEIPNDGDHEMADEKKKARLLTQTLDLVFKMLASTTKAIRIRGCQFIGFILDEFHEQKKDGCLNDKYWRETLEALRVRCMDKVARVRFNAVDALGRLQQPEEPDCKAMSAILFLMEHDPTGEIRRLCVHKVSVTKSTMKFIVGRCRDTSDTVRHHVYKDADQRGLFKVLTIEQRLTLLQQGLTDRVEHVRNACEEHMVVAWLKIMDDNIFKLLRRLDVITASKTCELLLDAYFKRYPLKNFVALFEEIAGKWKDDIWLTPENVFSLRYFIRLITATPPKLPKDAYESICTPDEADEWMEGMVPPLFHLADFIEKLVLKNTDDMDIIDGLVRHNFIIAQLLEILAMVDKSDIAGRKRLQVMMDNVVHNVNLDALPALVRVNIKMNMNIGLTTEWMADVIADLVMPPEQNGLIDDILVAGTEAGDTQPVAVPPMNEASRFKALTILAEVLKSTLVTKVTTTLRSMCENLVLPSFDINDPAMREIAFRCLGLMCLVDLDMATQYTGIFLEVLKVDVVMVRKTAIETLFDLLIIWRGAVAKLPVPEMGPPGSEENSSPRRPKITGPTFICQTFKVLDSEDTDLHEVVKDGIAKLRKYYPEVLPVEFQKEQ